MNDSLEIFTSNKWDSQASALNSFVEKQFDKRHQKKKKQETMLESDIKSHILAIGVNPISQSHKISFAVQLKRTILQQQICLKTTRSEMILKDGGLQENFKSRITSWLNTFNIKIVSLSI